MRRKIKSLGALLRTIAPLRRRGKRIVFTNGCFDILHPGHIKIFTFAKRRGDILVVGLNSDSSVRALKGSARPIVDERSRAKVIEALEAVDFVVLFQETTPLRLIKLLKPDVLVKGGDYSGVEIVGADCVPKVCRVPLVPSCSSTRIIEKIQKRG